MTHKIAQILDGLGKKAAAEIDKLEMACGYPSEDVRLLAQSTQAVRQRLAELSLDPDDTTPSELYHALQARYQKDAQVIEAALGLDSVSSDEQKTQTAIELTKRCLANANVWALKRSFTKQLIKNLAPNRTKKLRGFRSVDSMLKRANVGLILLLATEIESPTWKKKLQKQLNQADTSRWEMRPILITRLPLAVRLKKGAVAEKTTGTIGLTDSKSTVLSIVLTALHEAANLSGRDFTDALGKVHPVLAWWTANSHLVAWLDHQPVSLNIYDAAKDYENGSYEQRSYQHGGQSFWRRLLNRYEAYEKYTETALAEAGGATDTPGSGKLTPELVTVEDFDV